MSDPIRILIIESQTLTRIGIKTVLSEQNDIEIVRSLKNGAFGYIYKFLKIKSLEDETEFLLFDLN